LLPAIYGLTRTHINYEILDYLPKSLSSVRGQSVLEESFSAASTGMLICEGLAPREVLELKTRLATVGGVAQVLWVDDLADITVPAEFLPDAIRSAFYGRESTLLMVRFSYPSSSPETQQAVTNIRGFLPEGVYLCGSAAITSDTRELSRRETLVYMGLGMALVLLVLVIGTESAATPVLFLVGVGIAAIYNLGTNIVFRDVSYITNSVSVVLQVGVTMDYSIFLLHRYEEEKARSENREFAMAKAIDGTLTAISGSALTTIAGFLALCVMRLTIGRDIGLVMAKGVLIGVASVVTVLPALVLTFDPLIERFTHRSLVPSFSRAAGAVIGHYKVVIVLLLIALFPAAYGSAHAPLYYNLDDALPGDLPSVVAARKLKADYSMAGNHFIVVDADLAGSAAQSLLDRIRQAPGVDRVLAYSDLIGPSIPAAFVPDTIRGQFVNDGHSLITVYSTYGTGAPEEAAQLRAIKRAVADYDPDGMLAGEGPLTMDLAQTAQADFARVNWVSVAAILVIVLCVFESALIPLILVLAIELAIMINMGIPYFFGTPIPFISSIVIGTIQLGATVDYAILITSRFREELRRGRGRTDAMRVALESSARSIATSAFSLFAATSGAALVSRMGVVRSLCALIARGALVSMAVIIIGLPPILLVTEPLLAKLSRNWRKSATLTRG
jgi:predicted RND superfamily exporter protein